MVTKFLSIVLKICNPNRKVIKKNIILLLMKSLHKKIKAMEKYLGPRVDYCSDPFPFKQPERWLMEYLNILKKRQYRKKKKL